MKKYYKIMGITLAILLMIPLMSKQMNMELNAQGTSLFDSFIREGSRRYAEPIIYINSTEIVSLIPENPNVTALITEAGEDYHNFYVETATGSQMADDCNGDIGPFKVELNLTRGSDINFQWGNDSNVERYMGSYSRLLFKNSEIDRSATEYDIPGVNVFDPSRPLGVEYTDELSGTTMNISATKTTPPSWWQGYDDVLAYQSATYYYENENGTTSAIDLKGYTIKPIWENLSDKNSFTVGIIYLSQPSPGSVEGINAIQNIEVTFNITEPTTTQLQAPTLTLESDTDNGGLKYTIADAVNNDKASSYAIDLFSDSECNTKVGNSINVSKEAMNGNIPLGNGITAGNTYYAKVKAVGDGVAYSDSPLSTPAVSAAAANEPVVVKNISFTAMTANGSSTETTSELTFTFSDDIDNLTADKITLSGVSGVTKGNLTKENKGVYKLAINNVSVSGTLKATIASIDGYSITPNEKTVSIYYAAPITNVVWSSAAADGVANKTTSTKIDVVFDTPITNLTKENFSIENAQIDSLSGSNGNYSLAISNVTTQGEATLTVTSPSGYSISPTSQKVTLHKKADLINAALTNVTADGDSTHTSTQLTLTFNQDITGLSADHITLTGINNIVKGSLSKADGTGVYTLAISGFTTGGTVNVSVSGVEGYNITGNQSAVIHHYTEPAPVQQFTIHYDLAGGTGSYPDQKAALNADITIPNTVPVKSGYTFTGWKLSTDSSIKQPGAKVTSSESKTITLTAQWTKDDIAVSFEVFANGTANISDTTQVTVTFDQPVIGLTKENFSLTNATVTEISGSGKTYILNISNVTTEGSATLTVTAPSGYTIASNSKTVTLHKDTKVPVSLTAVEADGIKNQASTSTVTLKFDLSISLTAENIKITDLDGTGAVIGNLRAQGNDYELTLNNLKKSGRIKIEIINVPAGYVLSGNGKEVNVLYVTDSKKPETSAFYDQVIDNGASYELTSNVINADEYTAITYQWFASSDSNSLGDSVCNTAVCSVTLNDETKYYTLKVTVTEGDNKATEYTAGKVKVTANAEAKYVVNFELNGGTGQFTSISQSLGSEILLNGEEPQRKNYIFTGWKGDDGISYAKNGTIKSPETSKTYTLTAQWKAEGSGNTGGGTGGGSFGGGSSKNEGWKEEKDGTYYYENGKLVTGFKEIEAKTYYFNNEGKMVTGFNDINSKTYYFDQKGVMKKASWFEETRKRYYAYADGVIAKGWLPIESDWYYMNPTDGHLMKDWVRDGNDWYFMGPEDGKLWRQHWAPDNSGNWYYVDLDGKMIYNTWIPSHSGYWYYIGSDGKMVSNAMVDGCWINSLGIYQSPTYQG